MIFTIFNLFIVAFINRIIFLLIYNNTMRVFIKHITTNKLVENRILRKLIYFKVFDILIFLKN